MRILIVAPRVPWPPVDGGRVAMARLAESFSREGGDVEVLSLNPRKHRVAGDRPLPVETIEIDTSRTLGPAIRAMTSKVPFIVARFESASLRSALRKALSRFKPDVVQIESPFMLPYASLVRADSKARVVLRSLNVEFRIWEQLAQREKNPVRRLALRGLARSLRHYEAREMNRLDAIVPISDGDAADFRSLGVTVPMYVVPCGVPVPENRSDDSRAGTVGFIGSLDFLPNQDAARWILDELWPRIAAAAPDATLSIAGSSPPSWLAMHARERGIELKSNVPDAAAFVRSQSVFIAPLFAGGGMRIKVVEAMALGKAVVATTIGAGGIAIRPGVDIVIADDADAFASAVVRLLRDPAERTRLGAAARQTVVKTYDSDALARGLLRFYDEVNG